MVLGTAHAEGKTYLFYGNDRNSIVGNRASVAHMRVSKKCEGPLHNFVSEILDIQLLCSVAFLTPARLGYCKLKTFWDRASLQNE